MTLILVRGHSGSGKSTFARGLVDGVRSRGGMAVQVENDDFFLDRFGTYAFDPERHAEAKEWARENARVALAEGYVTVVATTFTTLAELRPYLDLDPDATIVEMAMDHPNVHGVPARVVEAKKAAFEPCVGALVVQCPVGAIEAQERLLSSMMEYSLSR